MKRSTPLRRTGRLPRRAPLRAKGGARFPKRVDEAFRDWIRSLPCVIRGCNTRQRVECSHVKTRGAGGHDVGNCLPLCRSHHDYQHLVGIKTFQAEMHLDMADLARRLGEDFLRATHDQEDAGR